MSRGKRDAVYFVCSICDYSCWIEPFVALYPSCKLPSGYEAK